MVAVACCQQQSSLTYYSQQNSTLVEIYIKYINGNLHWRCQKSLLTAVVNRIIVNASLIGWFDVNHDCRWWQLLSMMINIVTVNHQIIVNGNLRSRRWQSLLTAIVDKYHILRASEIIFDCHCWQRLLTHCQWQSLSTTNQPIEDVLMMIPSSTNDSVIG